MFKRILNFWALILCVCLQLPIQPGGRAAATQHGPMRTHTSWRTSSWRSPLRLCVHLSLGLRGGGVPKSNSAGGGGSERRSVGGGYKRPEEPSHDERPKKRARRGDDQGLLGGAKEEERAAGDRGEALLWPDELKDLSSDFWEEKDGPVYDDVNDALVKVWEAGEVGGGMGASDKDESSYSAPEKVWCGHQEMQKGGQGQVGGVGRRGEESARGGDGESDELVYVTEDDADADVVVRRADDAGPWDAAAVAAAQAQAERNSKDGGEPPEIDAEVFQQLGWDYDKWGKGLQANLQGDEETGAQGGERGRSRRSAKEGRDTEGEGSGVRARSEKGGEGQLDEESSDFHWGVTSDSGNPGGDRLPWYERVEKEVKEKTGLPFFHVDEDGHVSIPKVKELQFPPCPTPGVAPEQGGAIWRWDDLNPEEGKFKGRWLFNNSVDPQNGYDLDELEAAWEEQLQVGQEMADLLLSKENDTAHNDSKSTRAEEMPDLEIKDTPVNARLEDYDPMLLEAAEQIYPGVKKWLRRGAIERHDEREDADVWGAQGPPLHVLEDEYEIGGRSAVYTCAKSDDYGRHYDRHDDAGHEGCSVFQPVQLDLRPALNESGSNVSSLEEITKLGYCPGYPRLPPELRGSAPNTLDKATVVAAATGPYAASAGVYCGLGQVVGGRGDAGYDETWVNTDGINNVPSLVDMPYFPKGFLLQEQKDAQRQMAEKESLSPSKEEKVTGLSWWTKDMWIWNWVDLYVERMENSTSEHERSIAEGIRESLDCDDPSPAVLQLYQRGESELDRLLMDGRDVVVPEWAPSEERMKRDTHLARVFEARCERENDLLAGNGVPSKKHRGLDEFEKLYAEASPEERTRWPYVMLPHWTYDMLPGSKKGIHCRNETLKQWILQERDKVLAELTPEDRELAASSLTSLNKNETHWNELWDEAVKEIRDIDEGRAPKPAYWPEEAAIFRAMGIDPYEPFVPNQVGEGKDIWGPHPETGKCHNTYCKYCYETTWKGDQIDNPKFQGRRLSDLSNDELHELGVNPYWASFPKGKVPNKYRQWD